MTREQFVNMLVGKFYQSKKDELIKFDDGSILTEDFLCKILDVLQCV